MSSFSSSRKKKMFLCLQPLQYFYWLENVSSWNDISQHYFEALNVTGYTWGILVKMIFNTLRSRQMATIFQIIYSNEFSWMKLYEFQLKFHWILFLRVQLTIFQHWLRSWLGADQVISHYLNQWWLHYWHIFASLGLNGLTHWGRVTHICVSKLSILGSDNGLSPGRRQAII